MAVIQSLGYKFQNDCKDLRDSVDSPNDLLKTDGDYPILLVKALQKDVNFETLCILNSFMGFLPMWDRKIADTIRYPEVSRKVKKYMPFLSFDRDKMKSIIVKELI